MQANGNNLCLCADLATWHYEGLVFNGTAQMTGMPVDAPYRIERPKVRMIVHGVFSGAGSYMHWTACFGTTMLYLDASWKARLAQVW